MSHPEAPDGQPLDAQNEAVNAPQPEVVAEHAGATALAGETSASPIPAASETAASGRATLDQIRSMFRQGVINASGGDPRPNIVRNNPAEHQQMLRTVESWRNQYEPDDPVASEVARRLASTWVKVAAVQENVHLLVDEVRLVTTLSALYADASHAVINLGLKATGVANALYNTKDELDQAKTFVDRSRSLRASDFKTCAEGTRQDVLGAVVQADKNAMGVLQAIREGKVRRHEALNKKVIIDKAVRHKTEEGCIDAINEYLDNVDTLVTKYGGHASLTPRRIKEICGSTANPEKTIAKKLEVAKTLVAQFEGQGGLTKSEIETVVFDHSNPRKKLQDAVRAIPAVNEALGGRLLPSAVRELVLSHSNPVKDGLAILERTDKLKEQLADNPEVQLVFSDADFVQFAIHRGGDAQKAARFAHRVVAARGSFHGNPNVTEAIIRKASHADGDVIQNVRELLTARRDLSGVYLRQGVPPMVIEKAVSESASPEQYVKDFVRDRDSAIRQFGDRFTASFINEVCFRHADPLGELGRYMASFNSVRQAPENARLSDQELMDKVVKELTGEGLRPYNVETIIADMQRYSREHRRGGSRAHIDRDYVPQIDRVKEQLAEWVDEIVPVTAGLNTAQMVDRFGRMYYNYIRYGTDQTLTNDLQMLRAVFEDYCNYVRELARNGFSIPEAVAQFNPRDRVFGQGQAQTDEIRQKANAGNLGSLIGDRDLGSRLRRHFPVEVDPEFQDRVDALTDDERALLDYFLGTERNPEREATLRERLRTDDLAAYYKDLLRYLQLQQGEEAREQSDQTAEPSNPTHPVYDPHNEEQRRSADPITTGGGRGSTVQELQSDIDRTVYLLEEEFANDAVARAVERFGASADSLRDAVIRADAAIAELESRRRSLSVDIAYAENNIPEGQTGPDEALVQQLHEQNDALSAELTTLKAMKTGALNALTSIGHAIDHANSSRAAAQTASDLSKTYRGRL